jgi:hypothetical protein
MSKNHKTTKSTKTVKTVEAAKAPEIAKTAGASPAARWALVLTLAVLAFSATYGYAIARGSAAPAAATYAAATAPVTPLGTAPVAGSTTPKSGAGCACCSGAKAPAGAQTSNPAEVTGNVQKITVDTSKGYYDPSTIELRAGIPAEITFTQASGCLQYVQSADLGFSEDLSGGPKTVELDPLAAGTYGFNCGMQMQFGSIVVK